MTVTVDNVSTLDAEGLRDRLLTARETIERLNRRCQSAESGLLAKAISVRFKSAVEQTLRQQLANEQARGRRLRDRLGDDVTRGLAKDVVRLVSEIEQRCPADQIVKRWVVDAKARAQVVLDTAQEPPPPGRA